MGDSEQQSIEFAEKMKQTAGEEKVVLEILEGAEHGDPIFETPENVTRVPNFLDRHLQPGRKQS